MKLTLVTITPSEQIRIDSQIRKAKQRELRLRGAHETGRHDNQPAQNCPTCK